MHCWKPSETIKLSCHRHVQTVHTCERCVKCFRVVFFVLFVCALSSAVCFLLQHYCVMCVSLTRACHSSSLLLKDFCSPCEDPNQRLTCRHTHTFSLSSPFHSQVQHIWTWGHGSASCLVSLGSFTHLYSVFWCFLQLKEDFISINMLLKHYCGALCAFTGFLRWAGRNREQIAGKGTVFHCHLHPSHMERKYIWWKYVYCGNHLYKFPNHKIYGKKIRHKTIFVFVESPLDSIILSILLWIMWQFFSWSTNKIFKNLFLC